jgi:hypothetical protein
MFHMALRTQPGGESLSISISGDHGPIASASGIMSSSIGLGRAIQPGNYTVILQQEIKGKGVRPTNDVIREKSSAPLESQSMHRIKR